REYNNLTNYELYSEYKKLNTDRINGSILHAYKDWERYSHDYTNYLKQIEDILHKRGYKIGDKGPVEIEMNLVDKIKSSRARKKERIAEDKRVEEYNSALDNYFSKLKEQKKALEKAVYYEGGTNLPKDGLKIEDKSIGEYYGGYETLVGHKQHAEFEPIDPRRALIQDNNRYHEYMSKGGCVDCYYSKDANATQIVFRGVGGGWGSWNITVKGQVSLDDGAKLIKHLQDKNLIQYSWLEGGYQAVGRKAGLTNYEREAIGKKIQEEVLNFFKGL
ncbi:hypothetical protein IJO12_05770, partial [bacterium]|nr:hypothetical protein [bacterium]